MRLLVLATLGIGITVSVFGSSGLFKGSLNEVFANKTELTQELCEGNKGTWSTPEGEGATPACAFESQPVKYVEEIKKVVMKRACDGTAEAKWEDAGCSFAGKTFSDESQLKGAQSEYVAFKETCVAVKGIFSKNSCAVTLASGAVVASSQVELKTQLLKSECDAAKGTLTSDGKCDAPGIGIFSSGEEARSRKFQLLCVDARSYADSTWPNDGTCVFGGKTYTAYADLSAAIENSKKTKTVCVYSGGAFTNGQCSFDAPTILNKMCVKVYKERMSDNSMVDLPAWVLGVYWYPNNFNAAVNASIWCNGAGIAFTDPTLLMERMELVRNEFVAYMKQCTDVGGIFSFPSGLYCTFNNKQFVFTNRLAFRAEAELTAKTNAQGKTIDELQTTKKTLQDQAAREKESSDLRIKLLEAEKNAALNSAEDRVAAEKSLAEIRAQLKAAESAQSEAKALLQQSQGASQSAAASQSSASQNAASQNAANSTSTQNLQIELLNKQLLLMQQQFDAKFAAQNAPKVACADSTFTYDAVRNLCIPPTSTAKATTTAKKKTTTTTTRKAAPKASTSTSIDQKQLEEMMRKMLLQMMLDAQK